MVAKVLVPEVVEEVLVPEMVEEVLIPEMGEEVLVQQVAAEVMDPELAAAEVLDQALDLEEEVKGQELDLEAVEMTAPALDREEEVKVQALDLEVEEVKVQVLDQEAAEVNRACTAKRKTIRSNSHMISSRCSRTEDSSVYDSSTNHSSWSNILRIKQHKACVHSVCSAPTHPQSRKLFSS
jgi:hypothetical protein